VLLKPAVTVYPAPFIVTLFTKTTKHGPEIPVRFELRVYVPDAVIFPQEVIVPGTRGRSPLAHEPKDEFDKPPVTEKFVEVMFVPTPGTKFVIVKLVELDSAE
jgi:hypothetical protein